MRIVLAIFLLSVRVNAATLYVKPTTDAPIKIAFDSASTNDGAHVGGVLFSTNSPFTGGSAAFDGSSGCINMGKAGYIGTNDFTAEAWVKPTSSEFPFGCSYRGGFAGRFLVIAGTNLAYAYVHAPTVVELNVATNLGSSWRHIALSCRRGGPTLLFLNGVLIASNATAQAAAISTNLNFLVGAQNSSGYIPTSFGPGNASDVRVWNYAKTDFSDRTNRLAGDEPGLVGYWKLDERQLDGADWTYAYTNIQAAVNASANGNTILVAPGIYNEAVTINKSFLTVQGGNGTLWDADRTIIDRQGALNSVGVSFSGATNSALRGLTITGSRSYGVLFNSNSNKIDSCVVRGNHNQVDASVIRTEAFVSEINNCIVVGNSVNGTSYGAVDGYLSTTTVQNCIIEANQPKQGFRYATIRNSIIGNWSGSPIAFAGGNITNNTTNSVMRLLNIAPASDGVGTNLVWAGVGAYIPRIGSVAQNAGVAFISASTSKSGDGGPSVIPFGFNDNIFLDATTNGNDGYSVSNYTSGTLSSPSGTPSARSVAQNGYAAIGVRGSQSWLTSNAAFTAEGWMYLEAVDHRDELLSFYAGLGDAGSGASGFSVGINDANATAKHAILSSPTVTWYQVNYPFIRSNWYHLAWAFNGTSVVHYVNGAAIGTNSFSHASTSTNWLWIGGYDRTISGIIGSVSDVRLWDYARTRLEITNNYMRRVEPTTNGLRGNWCVEPIATLTSGPFNIRNPTLQPSFMEAF